MRIIINGIEAVLKSGTSFDYVTENRYFTGADAYTMAITFPIAGCERNQKIFGNINRKDIQDRNILLDCDIYAKNFHKKGSITVTEITDKTVKCQFLEGRSVDNFYSTLDDVFINELDLSYYPDIKKTLFTPGQIYRLESNNYKVLPWCNGTSGIVHNAAVFETNDAEGKWWDYENNIEDNSGSLSCMPYLLYIFEKICLALGYECETDEWANSRWKDLLICNVVPESWDKREWNFILPHWSVSQFFEECENLMNCQINVNNVEKVVSIRFYNDIISRNNVFKLDNVIKDYNSEITDEDESEYNESSIIRYAECSHRMWQLYTLDWTEDLINSPSIKSVATGLMTQIKDRYLRTADYFGAVQNGKLYMDNTYNNLWCRYVIKRYPDYFYPGTWSDGVSLDVLTIGQFKPSNKDNGQKNIELSIVPVWLDYIERNDDSGVLVQSYKILFMDCGELHNDTETDSEENNQSKEFNVIKAGKKEATAVFDKLYVGFYENGTSTFNKFKFYPATGSYRFNLPHPIIEEVNTLRLTQYYTFFEDVHSLRLDGQGLRKKTGISINQYEKFNIKFIANEIPDVYSIFLIDGRKFLCKKITATFKEDGMSQLLKGEFYQITN